MKRLVVKGYYNCRVLCFVVNSSFIRSEYCLYIVYDIVFKKMPYCLIKYDELKSMTKQHPLPRRK